MGSPFDEVVFFYSKRLRERFREGKQHRQWRRDYPKLFSTKDAELAMSQPSYHFFEWLGAILMHEATGYRSCMKWNCFNHVDAMAPFRQLVPRKFGDRVLEDSSGYPDLFLYAPDHSDWFFCEVKGERDKVRANQLRAARRIFDETGRKVVLLSLRPVSD